MDASPPPQGSGAPAPEARGRFQQALPSRLRLLEEASRTDPTAVERILEHLSRESREAELPEIHQRIRSALEQWRDREAPVGDGDGVLEELAAQLEAWVSRREWRILAVEDDATTAHLIQAALKGVSARVQVAKSAAEARQILFSAPPDLLILDLFLPDADGRSLLMEVRANPVSRQVPVVVVSGSGTGSVQGECFAYGAQAFLEKPVRPAVLAATVEGVLQRLQNGEPVGPDVGDPLLRLSGREEMQEAFRAGVERARAQEAPFSLALLLPPAGGKLDALRDAVGRLLDGLPPWAQVGRWNHEEVLVLFPGMSPAAAFLELLPLGVAGGVVDVAEAPGEGLVDAVGEAHGLLRQAPHQPPPAVSEPGGDPAAREAPVPHLVLVEDDTVTARLVSHRMERSGFHVTHFPRGDDALRALLATPPDLAVLDIRLPGMDGFEVLARLREAGGSTTPVLILTGVGNQEDVARGFQLGANDYLVKPFSPTELVARCLRLVRSGG